jgi:hypothetical protein
MLGIANSQTLRTVNFIVGLALLVMLFPKHGNLPEKPAGVRTAVELVSKRTALRTVVLGAAFA